MVTTKKQKQILSDQTLPFLRLLEERDLKNVCRWMTSSYILQHSFVVPSAKSIPDDFATPVYAARYFDMLLSDNNRVSFAIIYEGQHIGNVGLKDISMTNRTAECFIEIGERSFRGRGIGKLAMLELLERAFCEYSLIEVALEVLEFNFAAIKVYYNLGFIVRGHVGWHYDEFGQYWRVLSMIIDRENYLKNR